MTLELCLPEGWLAFPESGGTDFASWLQELESQPQFARLHRDGLRLGDLMAQTDGPRAWFGLVSSSDQPRIAAVGWLRGFTNWLPSEAEVAQVLSPPAGQAGQATLLNRTESKTVAKLRIELAHRLVGANSSAGLAELFEWAGALVIDTSGSATYQIEISTSDISVFEDLGATLLELLTASIQANEAV